MSEESKPISTTVSSDTFDYIEQLSMLYKTGLDETLEQIVREHVKLSADGSFYLKIAKDDLLEHLKLVHTITEELAKVTEKIKRMSL